MPNRNEEEGRELFLTLKGVIERAKGQFLRDDGGHYHLLFKGRRIPIDQDPKNISLRKLLIENCNVTTVGFAAKAAIQRLEVLAVDEASAMSFRLFSGLSSDCLRLYVPVASGQLLLVRSGGARTKRRQR